MICQDLENKFFELAEGTLTSSEQEKFQLHLEKCASCSAMLAEIKNFESQVRKEIAEEVNPFLAEKVIAKVKNQSEQKNKLAPALIRLSFVLIAGVAIGAALNFYLLKNTPENNIAEAETVEADDFFAGDETILSLNE